MMSASANPLLQYADLYNEHSATINNCSLSPLNALRASALQVVVGQQLPARGSEDYERTSLAEMFAPDYGLNISRLQVTADVAAAFHCGVPAMSTYLAVVVNDTIHLSKSLSRLPEGVRFCRFSDLSETDYEWLAGYYGKIAGLSRPEVALNTLLAQDGLLVRVNKGVHLSKPLQIVNLMAGGNPVMAVRRLLVVMEEDSEAQLLICDHTGLGAVECMSSSVSEIVLERNARLDLYDMEEASDATSRCSAMYVTQQEGSHLLIDEITLNCGRTRNDFDIRLEGEHCDTFVGGMAIGSAHQKIDNHTNIVHAAPRCHSHQLFKYVLSDEADGAFEGSIYVAPGAVHTESYQSNRNIIASVGARMHSKPQLEIYCDDVKCSHGSATGQLDQEALFYMRTRGIPEADARRMLMQAFMSDVIDSVRMPGLNDRLRQLVDRRLSGDAAHCIDCRHSCADDASKQS